MRIGIDGLPLTEVLTGIGHYTNELAHHLSQTNDDKIEVVSPRSYISSLNSDRELPANLSFVRSRVSLWNRHWWSIGLPRHVRRHAVDVFHGTNFEIPLQRVCATVITIHDLSMLPTQHAEKKLSGSGAHYARTPSRHHDVTPTASARQEA
jgi:hypothetical protein